METAFTFIGPLAVAIVIQVGVILVGYYRMQSQFQSHRERLAGTETTATANERNVIRLQAELAALRDMHRAMQDMNEENFVKIESKLDKIDILLHKILTQNK